eukprot:853470_1
MSKDTQPSLFSFFPSTSSTSSSAVPPSKESSAGPSNPRHSSSSSKLRKIKKTIRKGNRHKSKFGDEWWNTKSLKSASWLRRVFPTFEQIFDEKIGRWKERGALTSKNTIIPLGKHSKSDGPDSDPPKHGHTREVTRAAIHCEPCRSRFVRENKRSVPPGKRPSDGPVTIEHLRPLRRKLCSRGDKVFVWGVPVPEGVDEDIPKGLASVSRDIPRESKSKNDLSIPTSETSQSSSQIRPNMPESKSDENHPSSQSEPVIDDKTNSSSSDVRCDQPENSESMESGLVSAPNSSGKSELVNPPVKQISKSSKSARSSYHDESIYHRLSVQHSSLKSDTKSAWNTAEQKSNEQISKHMAGLEMVCTCIYTIAKHNRPLLMMDEMIFVLESAMDSLRRANYDIPADIISSSFKKDNNRKISKTLTAMLNFIEKDVNTVIGQSLRAESKSH